MKVLLFNGSPKKNGCTYTALCEVERELQNENIDTEIIHIGGEQIRGCVACMQCFQKRDGRCAYDGDIVNIALKKAQNADAFIIGSPVYFASGSGQINCFLDRFFFVGDQATGMFKHKLGASVVSCRRGGSTAALDQINRYFTIANMPVVASQYWSMVHGMNPEEVKQDLEGMQIMRTLGRNMSWLLKSIDIGRKSGIELPQKEDATYTNFIR